LVDCWLLFWLSLKSLNYSNISTEFCEFLQVPWHPYQAATMFALEVTRHWKKSHFRRRSGYRSPVELCRKPRDTSQWRLRLVEISKNFLSPTKNFIFEKLKFFRKSKEMYRKNTRFNENFRKFLCTLVFIATWKFNFLIWSYFPKNFATTWKLISLLVYWYQNDWPMTCGLLAISIQSEVPPFKTAKIF